MLITPLTAFAPQSVAPGPVITSIRSISSNSVSCASQNTPAYKGVYTVRPSIKTNILLAVVLLKPRPLIAHELESTWATCRLDASRKASPIVVAPDFRRSALVITWIADAVSESFSGRRDTEVTSRSINSSTLRSFKELEVGDDVVWAEIMDSTEARITTVHSNLMKVVINVAETLPAQNSRGQRPVLCISRNILTAELEGAISR